MKFWTIAAIAAAATTLAACVSSPQQQQSYRPQEQSVSVPALNEVHEVGIGEEVVKDGRFVIGEAIYVPRQLVISMYTIAPGYFKKSGQSDDGDFFLPGGGTDGGQIIPKAMADPAQALLVERKGDSLCVVTILNLAACDRPLADVTFASAEGFERRRRTEPAEGSSLRSLTYNGKAGSRIRLAYREVTANAALPPISNEVEYDLNASRVVEYRGARIEVLDATDRSIKYRVLQNFASR